MNQLLKNALIATGLALVAGIIGGFVGGLMKRRAEPNSAGYIAPQASETENAVGSHRPPPVED